MRGFDRINAVLPDELILEIFRHVESKPSRDACSLVCKRWLSLERLSRDTIRIGASASPGNLVKLLSSRFPNIRYVFIDERLSVSLPVQCRKRRRHSRGSTSSGRFCHGSEQSVFGDDGMGTGCLSDSGLATVGDRFVKLEKLSLIWCSSITDVGLRSLAEKCKSLRSLDLQGCYIGDKGLAAVGECCNFLEKLNLRFCEGLTDTGLVKLAIGCGGTLKSLGVAACAKITDISFEAVGSHCRSLESLSLDSETIHNKGLLAMAKGCSALKVLKLQCLNITDDALQAVGIFCLSLESLALYSFQKFTDSRLSELALLYCQRIESDGLSEIGKGCKFLQALHLVDCSAIGDDSICSIARGIGDEALISIGQGCSLHHLNVSGCHQIGDAGIIAIARGCPQLSYLDVSVLQNLGDGALMELGEGCPSLKDVVISHCRQITDIGLNHLVRRCTLMESCHMVYCPGITEAGVATMVTTCTRIKKILVEKWKVSARTKRRAGSIINYLCVDL
ncbi:hypothetical protein DH2020_048948 [Rehmannia glutinosa]|uniref:F-box domain-containing protein n=1 Tax=Rehmannia glutinosa TaxID=99300 RepID=A0ABR0U4C6_REHGL